jgi:dTDP-4-amino-4,6-dideoxygalactose transaminase
LTLGLPLKNRRKLMAKFLDFSTQYAGIADEIEAKVLKILRSSKYILSEEVTAFENTLSDYCNVRHAVGVANGTDSLVIALKALDIGVGDEVITTPFTFFATAEAISIVGATPVFADIDENNLCIDKKEIEKKITPRTKAILPVHIFGQMADMDEILDIASRHSLYVIEDACQAIGAEYKGRKSGSIGNIGCFSFYPTKNLSCAGDGGALVTNDEKLYEKILLLREHGSRQRYHNEIIGCNSRLDEIQAGILNVKFKYLDDWNKSRVLSASRYNSSFNHLKNLGLPFADKDKKHVYHLYSIKTDNRDQFKKYLDENSIGNGVYYPVALYNQKPYRSFSDPTLFPVTERVVQQIISLPMYPGLPEEQQDTVIKYVVEYFSKRND